MPSGFKPVSLRVDVFEKLVALKGKLGAKSFSEVVYFLIDFYEKGGQVERSGVVSEEQIIEKVKVFTNSLAKKVAEIEGQVDKIMTDLSEVLVVKQEVAFLRREVKSVKAILNDLLEALVRKGALDEKAARALVAVGGR